MLTKREPVNEDLEVGVEGEGEGKDDSDEEERKKLLKKIANSLGTEGNIAGINPYEPDTSKQPSKFKKMFLKMLQKNQYKKED
jgi:phenylacetate-coenzyme A ligase PaaK-like adenylate-forming protein